jgi:hypothetical protein
MCIQVCKCKNDTCWNYSRNRGGKEKGEGVKSCMIHLIHCKNLCKCYNVPSTITTRKGKKIHCRWHQKYPVVDTQK